MLLLALAFGMASGAPPSASDASLSLASHVTGQGCAPKLVSKAEHAFLEAQIACDAYLGLRLVDEVREGRDKEPRVRALVQLLDDALVRGQLPFRSMPTRTIDGVAISSSVLSRGYLMLLLSGLARIDALPPERVALYDGIASSLVDDLAAGTWLESFRHGRWPCDSALAASGLKLHGALRTNPASAQAGDALIARLLDALHAPGGFVTRVNTAGKPIERTPRGVTLAWTAGFLSLSDHAAGRAFADVLVRDFCDDPAILPGIAACREWPRGVQRKADAVSGPIVLGYGMGASSLAIAAARASGLADWADKLTALAHTAPKTGRFVDVVADPARYPLENAILLWGETAKTWL